MSAISRLDADDREPTCTFYWIRKRFGATCGDTHFAQFLEALIVTQHFPRPLPHRRHGGGIESGVATRSHWIRAGVLEWFGQYLPPDAAAAIDARERAFRAAEMDSAAASLSLVAANGSRRAR